MNDLTRQLDRIGKDILEVLKDSPKPLTQTQLHALSKLKNISENGWSFALDKLERNHLVEFVDPYFWKLKDPERKAYLNTVEQLTSTRLDSDT